MPLDQEILRQLMDSFREELAERMSAINAALLALEQHPEMEHRNALLEELFRNVHSLKGAARAVELKAIEELTHGMEDVFGAAKRGTIRLTPALFDLLYRGLDLIAAIMSAADKGQGPDPDLDIPGYLVRLAAAWRRQPIQAPQIETKETPKPHQQAPVPAEAVIQPWGNGTIRVPTARLDELLAQTGELLVTRLRAAQQAKETEELYTLMGHWQRDWRRMRGTLNAFFQQSGNGTGTKIRTFLKQSENNLDALYERLGELAHHAADGASRLSLVTDELQEGIKRTRMLPLATLVDVLRRVVRDLAREKGVEATLQVHGADTEMDKHVLEQIKDPLMHLLRNCIDHGIEPPEARITRGKSRRGSITLQAERRGNVIAIEVTDDGAGVDVEAVRKSAVQRDLLSPEAAAEMSAEQVTSLIFSAGLSTSPIITEVSGRGIGLDVVRKNIEALQGRAEVRSTPGQGTTFTLSLPLTLVSTRCLLFRAAGQTFGVPLSAVERMIRIDPGDVTTVTGQKAISYQGCPTALTHLADVLGRPAGESPLPGEKAPAVVLSAAGQRIAFLVDELLGGEELVVKGLGKQLARVPNVAGAAVLGSGSVALILNVPDLVKSAQQAPQQRVQPAGLRKETQEKCKNILVVDDSITTRTLERNILSTAGYTVRLATDGEEALAVLKDNHCDLIVSDVDMPRLDGFELIRRIKQDERYSELPVILVTSMGSAEDKARGIEVGADAYIVKGAFDQDHLLETIQQLI